MTTVTNSPRGAETNPPVHAASIWRLGIAFFSRKAIMTAAELGVFSLCADQQLTEPEIREQLSLHPRASREFLDALVGLGMLDRENGLYSASAVAAKFLDPRQPTYLVRFLKMADARWERLADGLRTGEQQNGTRAGAAMFTQQYTDSAAWRSYMVGMDYLNAPLGPRLAEAFDWNSVDSFVDVGGARGNIAASIVASHPRLKGSVFDLPPVRTVFDEHMAELGVAESVTFQDGDFFADPLPAADALIFGHVLHDWGESERHTLVGKAFAALPPGGAVLIYDPMIDDERRKASSLLVSLNMLLATPHGSEYTVGECRSWLAAAGFENAVVTPLDDHDTLVVARKPG